MVLALIHGFIALTTPLIAQQPQQQLEVSVFGTYVPLCPKVSRSVGTYAYVRVGYTFTSKTFQN